MAGFELLSLPELGETLGKYTIVKTLGEGGMGTVFEAVHEKLRQRVAIKVLKPQRGLAEEDVARFEREARLAARLKTSHAVRIFDVDVTSTGLPYIVMELIDGRDLADELRARGNGNQVSIGEIVGWTIQICEALTEAHALGIVHRDIKSSNILLVRVGKKTIAKLVDFGIAKDFGKDGVDTRTLTADGAWVGTPAYMAPEQFGVGAGGATSKQPIDARTDIWALGVMLYRSFAGRFPFEGSDGASMIEAITKRAPLWLCEVRPSIPAALSEVVMRAIRKAPAERHASAEAFAEALAPFASDSNANANANAKPEDDITDTVLHPATTKSGSSKAGGATKQRTARTFTWSLLGTVVVGAVVVAAAAWQRASHTHNNSSSSNTTSESPPPPAPLAVVVGGDEDDAAIAADAAAHDAAKPNVALGGRMEPSCVCEIVGQGAGGVTRVVSACSGPMTPRCTCQEDKSTLLCRTPWVPVGRGAKCADDSGSFKAPGRKTGEPCTAFSWAREGDDNVLTNYSRAGLLACEDCYGPSVPQAAVPHTPCRSYLGNGRWRDGTWACQSAN